MLKVILFDFNGVIINDEPLHRAAIDEVLVGENLLPVGSEFSHLCLGRSDRAGLRDVLARRGRSATEEYLSRLIEKKRIFYREKLDGLAELPLYPDTLPFVERVRARRLPIGLVTGAARSEVEYILEKAGIKEYFEVIVTGDEVDRGKPRPDGYLLAIERFNRWDFNLQLQPRECLAIEDSLAGCEAAGRAGMSVVGIANSYPLHFLQRASDWAIDNFSQLDLERVERVLAGDAEVGRGASPSLANE